MYDHTPTFYLLNKYVLREVRCKEKSSDTQKSVGCHDDFCLSGDFGGKSLVAV